MTNPNDLFEYIPAKKPLTVSDLDKKVRELLDLNRELMWSNKTYCPRLVLAGVKATDGIWDHGESWWDDEIAPDRIEYTYDRILRAIKSVRYIKDQCEGPLRSVKLTHLDSQNGFCDLVDGLVENGYDGQFFLFVFVGEHVLLTDKTMTDDEIKRFARASTIARQLVNDCMGYFVYLRPCVDEDYISYIELTYS